MDKRKTPSSSQKKMISLLLALILSLGLVSGAAGEAGAEGSAALPGAGDRIGNFMVKSVTPMEVLAATGILFEHEKNGAQLLYLASSDPNVSFDITFRTPALDDTGKAHVFEHMTICGSEKYPDANLFFPFINRTYNTFVNAATYQHMTTYPLSSMSEEQLMTMMDFYLSAVFQPLMKLEPLMVDREAWRYELNDTDSPLTIAGTVYSEMQGALSPMNLAFENVARTMFKDGLTAHISGGAPEAIRTLTWEDLAAFHDRYYHPSNALIVLYGKLDYDQFIRYIDDQYLSKFDRKDVHVERGRVTPYTQTAYAAYQAPVEASAMTQDASYIIYSFAGNDMSMTDTLGAQVLCDLMNNSASPLKQLANERMPGINIECYLDESCPVPVIGFFAPSVNESDRDNFVQLVDDAIAQMAEGIDPDLADATLSTVKLNLMLTLEDETLGVNASQQIALYWASFGSTNFFADYAGVIDELTAERLAALARTYLLDNAYRGVTTTVPAPGQTEANAQKLADELAAKKAAMSDEEIRQLLQKTQDFTAWSGAAPDEELIEKLAIMTVDKLLELLPEGELTDETHDGIRTIAVKADMGALSDVTIALDTSSIPVEQLCDASIAAGLLGNIATAQHSREELNVLIQQRLGLFSCSLNQYTAITEDNPNRYTFEVSTRGLGEKAEQGYQLVEEVLFSTDYTDISNIKNLLSQRADSIRLSLDSEPLGYQMNRAWAMLDDAMAVKNHVSGLNMYARLNELIAMADSDPEQLTARLRDALNLMLNRFRATVMIAGGANDEYTPVVKALLQKMPSTETAPVDYSVLRPAKTNEALITSLTVHMNLLAAPTPAYAYTGKLTPISALIDDKYMLPRLRNVLGAYGAYSWFSNRISALYTYRDPNLASSFQAFADLPEYLRAVEITQADVDSYIVGSYGRLLPSGGKLSQARQLADNRFQGISDSMYLGWQRDAKSTVPGDVKDTAALIESMLKTGIRSSSGAESTMGEAKGLIDTLIRLEDVSR